MKPIISDSYYLVSLYQDKFREINVDMLTNLLYLLEGYYMAVNDEELLYDDSFKIDLIRNIC